MTSQNRVPLSNSTNTQAYEFTREHFDSSMFYGGATSSVSNLMANINFVCEESIQSSPSTSLGHFSIHDNTPRPATIADRMPVPNAIKRYSAPLHESPSLNRKRRVDAYLHSKLDRQTVPFVAANVDHTIHESTKILQNLRSNEIMFVPSYEGFLAQQCEVDAHVRQLTVEWVAEVCEELKCDPIILPLTVNLFDRILGYTYIPRLSLQAFASACLLLAGKVKAPHPMSAVTISDYTDGGVSVDALVDCEATVITTLNWQLYAPTSLDFLDQMLIRCPKTSSIRNDFQPILRQVLQDHKLACLKPSEQAIFIAGYVARASGDAAVYGAVEGSALDLFDVSHHEFIKGVAEVAKLFPQTGIIKLIESEIAKRAPRSRKSGGSVRSMSMSSPIGSIAEDDASPCKQQRLESVPEVKADSNNNSGLKNIQIKANSVAARLLRSVSNLSNTAKALAHKSPSTNRRWSNVSQDSGVCSEASSPEVSRLSLGAKTPRRGRKTRPSIS